MTAPKEQTAFDTLNGNDDDDSAVTRDIIEQAYATDSMKKFQGKSSSTRSKKKKTKKPSQTDTDEAGYNSDDAVRPGDNDDADDSDEDEDILEEIYATDSMKRLKKKTTTAPVAQGRRQQEGSRRTTGLNPITEDKSAKNLVEGLRSFRLNNERLNNGTGKKTTFTPKSA